jgi:penicillin-binding protein 1A
LAEFAHLAGIKSKIPVVPSIALGSADLTLLEMLHAYSMYPNRGFSTEPTFISRIEDKNGNVLESFQPESKQIISEADAYTMYKMMQGVVDFGTGHSMRGKFGIHSAMGGKTGTTNDNTDGWYIGYTPQLLAGAWVGCDDPFLKIRWTYGGNEMAMPQYAYFMKKVYADKSLGIDPKAEFQRPAELDNNPIYADQNFSALVQRGEGSDFSEDQGNGDAEDYENTQLTSPVESDFSKDAGKDNPVQGKDKGGNKDPGKEINPSDKIKTDSVKVPVKISKKEARILRREEKNKQKEKQPVNDY